MSNRAVIATVMGCRLRGLDVSPLLAVFGEPVSHVVDPARRCSWDAYAEFTDRVEVVVGGSEAMEDMTFASLGNMESLRMFAAWVLDIHALYSLGVERIARFFRFLTWRTALRFSTMAGFWRGARGPGWLSRLRCPTSPNDRPGPRLLDDAWAVGGRSGIGGYAPSRGVLDNAAALP